MPKVNRNGQASIWTETDLSRFLGQIKNPKHLLFAQFFLFTGERVSAVCQLQVSDCYESLEPLRVRDQIIFRSQTRKRSKKGKAKSREVPLHQVLLQSLEAYSPQGSKWMFPSPRNPDQPVTPSSVDNWFRKAARRAGIDNRGYSLHSFRRTFITGLSAKGIDITVIQKITGHESLQSLRSYIEISPEQVKNAIDLL